MDYDYDYDYYPAVLVSAINVPQPTLDGWRVTDIEPILSPKSFPEVISLISCNPAEIPWL